MTPAQIEQRRNAGRALARKYGRGYMQELGRKGGRPTCGAGLGINGDFFIEHMRYTLGQGNRFVCTMQLSPAAGYSDFWVLDESILDTSTILAY